MAADRGLRELYMGTSHLAHLELVNGTSEQMASTNSEAPPALTRSCRVT